MTTAHVFIDTNILLHYKPLRDIDWKGATKAECVVLVICLQVVNELDDKKTDARLGTRAKRSLKDIVEFTQPGQLVRDGVTLVVYNEDVRTTDFPLSLNPDSNDDKIVHQALRYATNANVSPVYMATEDFCMKLRCQAHGIETIDLAPSQRLPDESLQKPTPESPKTPRLKLVAACRWTSPTPGSPYKLDIDDFWKGNTSDTELTRMLSFPSVYVEGMRTIYFDLWLGNDGSGAATDIDVFLLLPTKLSLPSWHRNLTIKDSAEKRTDVSDIEIRFSRSFFEESPVLPRNRSLEKEAEQNGGCASILYKLRNDDLCFHAKVMDLKHNHHQLAIKEGAVCFKQLADIGPFQAKYVITCSELATKTTGVLPFVVHYKGSMKD